jgi:hypothetical protein
VTSQTLFQCAVTLSNKTVNKKEDTFELFMEKIFDSLVMSVNIQCVLENLILDAGATLSAFTH